MTPYIILLVLAVAFVLVSWRLSESVIRPRRLSWKDGLSRELHIGGLRPGEFERAELSAPFRIKTYDGALLRCAWMDNPAGGNKVVILCHGHGCCSVTSYKYARLFAARGYHALFFDQRGHGESGGKYCTLGFRERWDLKRMVDLALERFGPDAVVGTHGESMGASTVMLHACMDSRIAFAVSDCGFEDMYEELCRNVQRFRVLPARLAVAMGGWMVRLRAGFSIRTVSPLRDLAARGGLPQLPVLFIHGTADTYVEPVSTERMFAAKRGKKALWECENGKHARNIIQDPQGYRAALYGFLDEYGL